MIGLYYRLWVDAIEFEKTNQKGQRNWKLYTLIPISIAQGVNLLTFMFGLKAFFDVSIDFNIVLFEHPLLNAVLTGVLIFLLPFVVMNYMLILRNDNYERLKEKYPYSKGRIYIGYFIISVLLFIVPVAVAKFLF